MVRRIKIPGTPYRQRVDEDRTSKVELTHPESVTPIPVVIEVGGGRSSTASAMRAARVVHELEGQGGTATTVSVSGECATIEGEADRDQVEFIAKMPFVKKISGA